MSDEATTTDNKEINFRALEAERDEIREERDALLKEVQPFRAQTAIREAGFDPDTDRGKVLTDLLGPDDGADRVKELADKYGWTTAPATTATEAAQVQGAATANQVRGVTSPDEPPTLNDQIAEAEQAGNFGLSAQLKLQQFVESTQVGSGAGG